jgi:hypothetical protein
MKLRKFLLLTMYAALGCAALHALNPRDVSDTSNIRISSPDMRAELLTNLMRKRLDLDNATVEKLRAINLKAEEELQKLVLDNPASGYGGRKGRGPDKFDNFSAAREDAYKKILGSKYSQFEKEQYGLRSELKKAIVANNENLKRQESARQREEAQAEKDRQAADLAARQRAYQEQKAAKASVQDDDAEPKKDKDKKGKKKKKKKKKK